MGAGIIPALFVSVFAIFWVTVLGLLIHPTWVQLAVAMNGVGIFIHGALGFSPYSIIAYLIHVVSILAFPRLNWTRRVGMYALFGAAIAISHLFVQITLDGIYTDKGPIDHTHLMVIAGALTALTVYALYGIVLYVAKLMILGKER